MLGGSLAVALVLEVQRLWFPVSNFRKPIQIFIYVLIKGATPPAADPWSRGLERKKKGLVVTCSCVGNVCVYFSSDPAMSEADLHVLSGALAFGGTETLGAGAFRGISRSALEVAGLEREEENNNSSSSNNKKNNNNNGPLPKRVSTMACRAQRRFRGPGASA